LPLLEILVGFLMIALDNDAVLPCLHAHAIFLYLFFLSVTIKYDASLQTHMFDYPKVNYIKM